MFCKYISLFISHIYQGLFHYLTAEKKCKQKTFRTHLNIQIAVMLIVFNTPYPIIFKVKFAVIVYFYLLCRS